MRVSHANSDWVFPAPTKSGHAEPSTIKDHHAKAVKLSGVSQFVLYTLRHTCLTRWAAHMDPYSLAYLAGHGRCVTTKRYVHPEMHTVLAQMEKTRRQKMVQESVKVCPLPIRVGEVLYPQLVDMHGVIWWAVTGSNCGPPACKSDSESYLFDFLSGPAAVAVISTACSALIYHGFYQRRLCPWEDFEPAGATA